MVKYCLTSQNSAFLLSLITQREVIQIFESSIHMLNYQKFLMVCTQFLLALSELFENEHVRIGQKGKTWIGAVINCEYWRISVGFLYFVQTCQQLPDKELHSWFIKNKMGNTRVERHMRLYAKELDSFSEYHWKITWVSSPVRAQWMLISLNGVYAYASEDNITLILMDG